MTKSSWETFSFEIVDITSVHVGGGVIFQLAKCSTERLGGITINYEWSLKQIWEFNFV